MPKTIEVSHYSLFEFEVHVFCRDKRRKKKKNRSENLRSLVRFGWPLGLNSFSHLGDKTVHKKPQKYNDDENKARKKGRRHRMPIKTAESKKGSFE
jgi:hypothetical protein